jgi:hypothetical protein
MVGMIRVRAHTSGGHFVRASLRARTFPNGYGITTTEIRRTGMPLRSRGGSARSLSITTRPTGMYARGIRPGGSALGTTYKRITPSSQRRFFALARRLGGR